MKLEPHRVGGERSARQSRPLDRAFALLDRLLAHPALVVESNDALGRAAHVHHDEADAGIKFSGMPFDLGDHPARLRPASGLIAEIGMEAPDFMGRSSDRTLEQIANTTLQGLVGRQPDRILDLLRFEKLVDCRNNPAHACRPFLPLRASARTSTAISVKPSTSAR